MRINARLDGNTEQQLQYITESTGQSISQVVRDSVSMYYAHVRTEPKGLLNFARWIGKGNSGHSDTASNYKQILAESWAAKHGLPKR